MDFLIKLQNIFLGLVSTEEEEEEDTRRPSVDEKMKPGDESDEDVDYVKHQEALLQENPGEDDDPDGGAGADHVHIRHGHVFQAEG